MPIIQTPIKDLVIYEPKVFHDDRGYFFESYNKQSFEKELGYSINFVQDNQARSVKNVLRGLHFQNHPQGQTKLVRVVEGAIWDVAVDLRKESATFGQWFGVELSAENKRQLLVPIGFAHGYAVLSATAEVFYKCDAFYNKELEGGLLYNDETVNVDWKLNINEAIISDKDKVQPTLAAIKCNF